MNALRKKISAGLSIFLFVFSSFSAFGQIAYGVAIAEVLYDSPLDETASIVHEGEFLSLYNYGSHSSDISGWRVEVTSLMSATQVTYNYTIPANTILPPKRLVIIASRPANHTFNVEEFYGFVNPGGHIVLYNNTLTLPNTRSRIRIYSGTLLRDEMVYDGTTKAMNSDHILRAENGFKPNSAGNESVSIQRKNISLSENQRYYLHTDYYPNKPERPVKMFSFAAPQVTFLTDLYLSGTITGSNEYEANYIYSTQIVESGNTKYTAGNEIVLNPGFEVKAGAEFEAIVSNDSLNNLTLMTYNVDRLRFVFGPSNHAQVILGTNPDVVALQEVMGKGNFDELKTLTEMDGEMFVTWGARPGVVKPGLYKYGLGILWKPSLGAPSKITTKEKWDKGLATNYVGYMIAEFADFCFASTHYWTGDADKRVELTKEIINHKAIKKCKDAGKTIYIAGDFNETPDKPAIQEFEKNSFEVLNDTADRTFNSNNPNKLIDLIIEYNTNPNHKTIDRGIPGFLKQNFYLRDASDHLPYFVKLKYK